MNPQAPIGPQIHRQRPRPGWPLLAACVLALPSIGAGAANLMAHWRFDQTEGPLVLDALGNLHGMLSPTGAGFVAEGISGRALSLNPQQDGWVNFGDVLPLLNQPFSISAWIKVPPGDVSTQSAVISKHSPGWGNGYGLSLNQVDNYGLPGKPSAFVASTAAYPIAPRDVNDGQWHHLVMTYDPGTALRLFVDGSPPAASSTAWPAVASPARLVVGGYDIAGQLRGRFNGLIDDIQVYDDALEDAEVDLLRTRPGRTLSDAHLPDLQILPAGGLFTNRIDVVIVNRLAGTTLHFTRDGSEPSTTSETYNSPVRLTAAAVITARAFLNGFPAAEAVTARFDRVYALDDGIPADWRARYFGPEYLTDPRAAADADPDGDGAYNLQEYTDSTHPLDPLSGFAVTVRVVPEIRFKSVAGQRYRIVRRERVDGPGTVVTDSLVATGSETRYVDASIVGGAGFFVVEPVR